MSDNEKKNITLEDWNNFFKCIRPVFEKQKTILEEKRKRGDLFNVFSILNVERKEVRHSAFLSALLDPNGKHGLGNKFLSDFIKNIVHQQKNIGLDWDCNDVYVNTEEPTDEKDGFMDIYLKSKGKIIIVENKIDAKDGEKQLIRYDNHARTKGDNHCLLYLTLNGQCANEISTDSKNTKLKVKKDYFPISYRDDILPWLERCLKIATQYPRVRETIAQYIDLIKKLTNTEDMSEDIITNTLKDENIDTIAYLLDKRVSIIEGILKHIGRIIMNDKKLKDIEWDDIDIIYEYGCQYPTMLFRPKGWKIFWFALYHDGRFGIYNAEISNANKPLDEEGKKYDEAKQHASNLGYFCILKKITFGKLELSKM